MFNYETNWQKELASAIKDPQHLVKLLNLDESHWQTSFSARKLFAMQVPRPFVARMKAGDPNDPLLLQVMTQADEFLKVEGYQKDPLAEHQSVLPGLLHKYQSRVLLMVRGGCAINCRYCFRRHFPYQDNVFKRSDMQAIKDYVLAHPDINEVVLSGGDPLMANDQHLSWLFAELAQLKQLTRIRIHTRLPVVIPQRITPQLSRLLANHSQKVVMVLHINHANEINTWVKDAFAALRQPNVTLLNQATLLNKVNDTVTAQVALSEALFAAGILPYYLFLLDKVEGAAHFDCDEDKVGQLQAGMLKALPGFLVPKIAREVAGLASKSPIMFKTQAS
ncbi:EF-P beta-lysylation protein EpmB [Gayadomonas joobiniege]|uniref:EF-P beta-lysylation protein EpmB n=1 Tax=Gayadomonas joobiniege TaxID=1234606 RepID=UPI00036C822F|nr:EF-P beta-lysylation protein EpmB [Gayadomonas joobiniege]